MSGVRADWHLDSLVAARDADPFASAVGAQMDLDVGGVPIDLTGTEAQLKERLVELVKSEGALAEREVTCAIRDRPDSTCSACPIAHHEDPRHPLSLLCRVGREQERTVMELHALAA